MRWWRCDDRTVPIVGEVALPCLVRPSCGVPSVPLIHFTGDLDVLHLYLPIVVRHELRYPNILGDVVNSKSAVGWSSQNDWLVLGAYKGVRTLNGSCMRSGCQENITITNNICFET